MNRNTENPGDLIPGFEASEQEHNCEFYLELIQLKLDREASKAEEELLYQHLAECQHCRQENDLFTQLTESLKGNLSGHQALIADPRKLIKFSWLRGRNFKFLAAACLMIILIGGYLISPRFNSNDSTVNQTSNPALTGEAEQLKNSTELSHFALKSIRPDVMYGKAMTELDTVEQGELLNIPDYSYIQTGATGSGELLFFEDSRFEIRESSVIQLMFDGIRLNQGGVWITFRQYGTEFKVVTPTAMVGIMGTEFGVEINDGGACIIRCKTGKINVKGISDSEIRVLRGGTMVKVDSLGRTGDITPLDSDESEGGGGSEDLVEAESWMY